jgi:hypothetical protein
VFTVSFVPDHIALFGSNGYQFFKNERNMPPSELRRIFPDGASYIARATIHKVGTTNKDRFLLGVSRLMRDGMISNADYNRLRDFIRKCDCAPPVIRDKLKRLGMGQVVEQIEFEDLHPELESTIDAMKHFVEEFHAKQKS